MKGDVGAGATGPGAGGAGTGAGGAGKIAGAPISWGVCEVPGWGYQLSPERVLAEMTRGRPGRDRTWPGGILAERSPPGRVRVLREHHLASVGGFVPVHLAPAGS